MEWKNMIDIQNTYLRELKRWVLVPLKVSLILEARFRGGLGRQVNSRDRTNYANN